MGNIIIKEYAAQHQDEIVDLILAIQQNEFQIPIKKEDQPDLSDIPNFYKSGNSNFWVAICDKEVVGTVALIDIGNGQGALRKMFVKAPYRGRTYNTAQLLLQQLIIWAKEHNIQELYLGTTDKFLAAHRFYEKNNFTQIDKQALPATFPIMKIDTRFYLLKTCRSEEKS